MATSPAPPFTSLVTLPASSSCHSSSSKLSPFHAFIRASASDHTAPATRCSQHTPRREFLKGVALQALPLLLLREPPPSLAREVEVGSFLPPSPSDPSFVQFKASPKDTPALRAGTLIFTSSQKRKKKKKKNAVKVDRFDAICLQRWNILVIDSLPVVTFCDLNVEV